MSPLPDPAFEPEFFANVPTKRLLAWVVDTVITVLIAALALPFTAFAGVFFFPALLLVVGFVYRSATLARGSATWGMRLFAIEIRSATGDRLDPGTAFLHTLGYTLCIAVFPLQALSILLMLTTPRGQGLSDHALGTVALNRRAGR